MRIRPVDIEVPAEDPFVNDRLHRRNQVEALASILTKVDGPFVLAVDAPWGEGKTTFLHMTRAYLKKNEFLVVGFNAWETDFSEDPFITLTTELVEQLEGHTQEHSEGRGPGTRLARSLGDAIKELRQQSLTVVTTRLIATGTKLLTTAFIGRDLSGLVEAFLPGDNESPGEMRIKSYSEQKQVMKNFRETLSTLAIVTKETTGRPLVIIVDELDRCRPTYAIDLLESIKHLFSVDGVVFILGLNRTELAHSVRAVYGERFKAERYLRRLVDIDLHLPRPDTDTFIDGIIESCEIVETLRSNTTRYVQHEYSDAKTIITEFLASSELSIRDIAQTIHHLGLVLASLPSNHYPLMQMTVILLVLRTVDRTRYDRFIVGEAADDEIVTSLLGRPGLSKLANTRKGAYIEAYIVHAYREILYGDDAWNNKTTLLEKYEKIITESESDTSEGHQHAKRVVDRINDGGIGRNGSVYARVVIGRIEMFAESISQ